MTKGRARAGDRFTTGQYSAIALAVIVAGAIALLAMGRVPICRCGYVKLWHGVVMSSENSQHLTDWYTFSHVIHGFAFYGLLWLVARHWSFGLRLVVAVLVETAWEVFENTPFTIDRYRAVTVSLDYYGDSVINSVADIVAMVIGFVAAARLPVWSVVATTIALEAFVGYMIRDNLALNILMLVYPLEVVKQWQMGG